MKTRYATLDAMRGVAALVVVAVHASAVLGGVKPRLGYLAVDLFFVLSGFVLAKRYDAEFAGGMTAWRFFVLRAKRLYPLYAVGAVLGLAALPLTHVVHGWGAARAAGAAALMLPSLGTEHQNWRLFPMNSPAWSLFFELWVANLGWALFARRLRGPVLGALILVAALGLILCEGQLHTLDQGWSLTLPSFLGGLARVTFSFGMGLVLARWHDRHPTSSRIPGGAVIVGLLTLLLAPVSGGVAHALELLSVLVIFPAAVLLGASATETAPALGRWLGDASFAVYAVHVPLLAFAGAAVTRFGAQRSMALELLYVLAVAPLGWALARADLHLRATPWRP